jgi:hypothetical protein
MVHMSGWAGVHKHLCYDWSGEDTWIGTIEEAKPNVRQIASLSAARLSGDLTLLFVIAPRRHAILCSA